MAPLVSPIPLYQAVVGWSNQQFQPQQTVTHSRGFRLPRTIMKNWDFLQTDPLDQKHIEQQVHLGVATTYEIKGQPTLSAKDNETQAPRDTGDKGSRLPQANTKYMEGNSAFPMPPASTNLLPGAYLKPNPIENDFIQGNEYDDVEDEGDCENEIDIGMCDGQFETQENHEGQNQRQPGGTGDGYMKATVDEQTERRKMKRFRQTRFLMSEFTRQAHPDAAHRVRLSKEIPGLSPRQVQVWFQNRRAKMKRLTSDNREKVLILRALPDNFDIAQTNHSYGSGHQSVDALSSAINYFNHPQEGRDILSPLMIDVIGRPSDEDYATSPLSPSSTCGGYFPSPGSASASGSEPEIPPKIIGSDQAALYASFSNPQPSAPRYMSPCTRSRSFSNAFSQTPYPLRPGLHQPNRIRPRAGSLGSPLRASISCIQTISDYGIPDYSSLSLDMQYNTHLFDNIAPQTSAKNNLGQAPHNELHKLESSKPSSLRVRTMPTSLSRESHVKAKYTDNNPALQSTPLSCSTPHEDQISPFTTTFDSNPFGTSSFGQHKSSSLRPPSSYFPFSSNGNLQHCFSAPADFANSTDMQSPTDGLRNEAYSSSFGFMDTK
ncbi:hypothetical protein ACJ72_00008 [Emergomyces africanus]|uniref:Homeobox domain-containing protein n=1 Tax=Emergomyces africanus TaxID=1955775 RepID=A0A1B7P978_9EURO|nr:hypothetical protein ACJ72_00008 [Emergomyces africanus]